MDIERDSLDILMGFHHHVIGKSEVLNGQSYYRNEINYLVITHKKYMNIKLTFYFTGGSKNSVFMVGHKRGKKTGISRVFSIIPNERGIERLFFILNKKI